MIDDDTVGWLFGSCVLYVYPFPRPWLSPIPPWLGPIDLKNLLVDDVVVVVVFSSRIPWAVHQHTLKGFVLFDHVPRLFIALTGIAFEILPPTTALLSFSFASFLFLRRRLRWTAMVLRVWDWEGAAFYLSNSLWVSRDEDIRPHSIGLPRAGTQSDGSNLAHIVWVTEG